MATEQVAVQFSQTKCIIRIVEKVALQQCSRASSGWCVGMILPDTDNSPPLAPTI